MSANALNPERNLDVIQENVLDWLNECIENEYLLIPLEDDAGTLLDLSGVGERLSSEADLRLSFAENFAGGDFAALPEESRRFFSDLLALSGLTDGGVYVAHCEESGDDEDDDEYDAEFTDRHRLVDELRFDDRQFAKSRLGAIAAATDAYATLEPEQRRRVVDATAMMRPSSEAISALTSYMAGDIGAMRTHLSSADFETVAGAGIAAGPGARHDEAPVATTGEPAPEVHDPVSPAVTPPRGEQLSLDL